MKYHMEMDPCSTSMAISIEDNGFTVKRKVEDYKSIRMEEFSIKDNGKTISLMDKAR